MIDLYSAHAHAIDYAALEAFVLAAEEADALTESLTLELKREPSKGVVRTVAAMANSDGGVVLVGVDEDARGSGRLVGLAGPQVEQTVNQLRNLLPPDSQPEIVSVAIPGTPRVVLVVRVNADNFPRPVVVGGAVWVRTYGQTVGATRDQIRGLARESESSSDARPALAGPRLDVPDLQMWNDGRKLTSLRVYGHLSLPRRAAHQPWLSTAAQDAFLLALVSSAVPDHVFSRPRTSGQPGNEWSVYHRTARSLHLYGTAGRAPKPTWQPRLDAAAKVARDPRRIAFTVAVRLEYGEKFSPLYVLDVGETVLALLIAGRQAGRAAAEAMDVAEPSAFGLWRAWVAPGSGSLLDVIDVRLGTGGQNKLMSYEFPPMTDSGGVADLWLGVKTWINFLLLDLGVTDFERDLDRHDLPRWARVGQGATA